MVEREKKNGSEGEEEKREVTGDDASSDSGTHVLELFWPSVQASVRQLTLSEPPAEGLDVHFGVDRVEDGEGGEADEDWKRTGKARRKRGVGEST